MSFEKSNRSNLSREEIEEKVIHVLVDMVQDWDLDFCDEIGSNTNIIEDLDFESIDLIELMVAMEKAFGVKGLPYETIFIKDGAYIDELQVMQLVDFFQANLNKSNR